MIDVHMLSNLKQPKSVRHCVYYFQARFKPIPFEEGIMSLCFS